MLLDSQARLAGIIDSAMDAILTVDEAQRIILFNAAAEKMFGYSADQILGKSLDILLPARYHAQHHQHIERFGRTGVTKRAMGKQKTLHGVKANGQEFPVEASISQLETAQGKLFTVILRDVTERVQTEEQLKENEQILRATFDQAAVGIVHMAPDGHYLRANHKMCEISGYSMAELATKSVYDLTPSVDWNKEQVFTNNLLNGLIDTYQLEKSYIRKDGSSIWVHITTSLVRDLDRKPKYFIKVIEDISKRKEAETALRVRSEEIQTLNAQTMKQVHLLSALRTIDLAISSSLDLRVTLNIVLEQVVTELAVDAADILLFDRYTQTLGFSAGKGFNSNLIEQNEIMLGSGYAGAAAYELKTIQVLDIGNSPLDPARTSMLERGGFQSYVVTPLIAKGEVKGVLEVYRRIPLAPDQEWSSFLEALAGQAAIAIDSAQLFERLQQSNQQLFLAYNTTIEGWSKALDLRDHETEGHTQRVTQMTMRLVRMLNGTFSEEDLIHIRRGALLHDIGKMAVPDSILLKPDKLTDSEWEIMRQHPDFAYELLYPIVYLRKALEIPRYHHERWDGSGYPEGLKGEQIPLVARIFAVVDVWDALLSDRPYRPGWPEEQVYEHIRAGAGVEFDPQIVELFMQAVMR